jgi:hypothetical protein
MARLATIDLEADGFTDPYAAKAAGAVVLAAAGAVGAALLGRWALGRTTVAPEPRAHLAPPPVRARALHASAALLSASVLADSAVEHYRGLFKNPGMYTPLAVSALSLAAAGSAAARGRATPRAGAGIYALATAVGAAGLGFHIYNLARKPGGFNWMNLFYAAPIGAPAALSLAGVIGLSANTLEAGRHRTSPKLLGLPAGRALSALTGLGLLGTVGEAGLLHFRGSFQNPFMWLPISLPTVAAALMGKAALERSAPRRRPLTRAWLALTAGLGLAGVGFHAYGVSRAMGGWRNWSQNVIDGPPLPAPPSFSALALAALSALSLRERDG